MKTSRPRHNADLFGGKVKRRATYLERLLVKHDKDSFPGRLERLKHMREILPRGIGLVGNIETIYLLREAELAFMNGAFIATIMLSQAFVEHWLQPRLESRGFGKKAKGGLKAIVQCCRACSLLDEFLLRRIDHLRQARNPLSHLKPYDHPFTLSQRLFLEHRPPEDILQQEAKNALSVAYSVLTLRL